MRPLLLLLGFVLGSAASISFSLASVAFVFWLLQAEHPRLAAELEPLLASLGIFLVLTAAGALSFYGELKRRPWRIPSAGLVAVLLVTVGFYYWPG